MDGWFVLIAIVVALLFAASAVRTVMGTLVRYILFVVFAALIYQQQIGEQDFGWLNLEIGQQLVAIAAVSLLATAAVIYGFFRRSRLKPVLWPVLGLILTFGITAVWTQQL